ncbi:hypothetical protein IQ13_1035 [Lacibacter cauensis]|uniref:Uncharacterized protein n=1 Tax=Lacibacter cauensis TaxID=510947 RepID=A0A562SYU2_9BACT|nr:hypothetical protein [Lacibacter cauensis]TWI85866.1 hypothetical protein IQ13_1035 [Lacibacter cauensis]
MKELSLPIPKTTAFDICKTALTSCEIDIEEECQEKNFLKGSLNTSLLSFGNNVEISLTESGQNTTIVISSKSSFTFQLIDWGKNAEIEDDIAKKIMQPFV